MLASSMPAFKSTSLVRSSLPHQRHQLSSAQHLLHRTIYRNLGRPSSPNVHQYSSWPFSAARHPQTQNLRDSLRGYSFARTVSRSAHTSTSDSPLHSSAISWIPGLVVALAASAIFYTVLPAQAQKDRLESGHSEEERHASNTPLNSNIMTGESLPGRPGTLTAAEEEKLREFWIKVLRVFGVLEHKEAEITPTPSITTEDTSAAKKPKKKRLGFLRKKDTGDAESTTSTNSSTSAVDATDDKHGLTKDFQHALASQSPESLRQAFWSMVKHDNPDALLLRFLRARKWDTEKALIMMVATMSWRATEMHVDDDIMLNGELGALEDAKSADPVKKKMGEDFLAQIRMGKSFLHGLDKENRPMCFVRVRLHKQGEQSPESLERYTVFVIESARMILSPPVDTACVVFDMTGFSMANMDYSPLKFMIKCFEANYPESLGVVLIHKAPWIFQGVWKIIRGWLDPVVASKVNFTNNNAEMEAFVPASRIITELEGSEDWAYKYIEPVPGENDKMKDTGTRDKLLKDRATIVDEYEQTTLSWIHGEGDVEAVKVARHQLAEKLKVDYWNLDPYIRARSYYDRVGLINPGGKLEFYKPAVAAPANGASRVETSAADLD